MNHQLTQDFSEFGTVHYGMYECTKYIPIYNDIIILIVRFGVSLF